MPSLPIPAANIGFVEATYKPIAECEDPECGWIYRDATAAVCRQHVKDTGHSVLKIKRTIGSYYVRT